MQPLNLNDQIGGTTCLQGEEGTTVHWHMMLFTRSRSLVCLQLACVCTVCNHTIIGSVTETFTLNVDLSA
jgi:hypothetical protein